MLALDAFPVREPVSKRVYTCLRLGTRSGATGFGECSRIAPTDLTTLRGAIQGKEASSFESIRRGLMVSRAALAALDMAMLDLVGKFTNAPVYQVLGGPTRNQVRALARIEGETDDAVVAGRHPGSRRRTQGLHDSRPAVASQKPQRHPGGSRASKTRSSPFRRGRRQ